MKVLKGIGLFFIYPVMCIGIGFLGGVCFMDIFYPSNNEIGNPQFTNEQSIQSENSEPSTVARYVSPVIIDDREEIIDVSQQEETIKSDTEYILEEVDLNDNNSIVETKRRIPDKYIGMNREQFIEAMNEYATNPPLGELDRGFVGLEVLNFSASSVRVQMNYQYVKPSQSFYLKVSNNYVVVYLEDKETVYQFTNILLTDLPDKLQQDIINVMYLESDEDLYSFL